MEFEYKNKYNGISKVNIKAGDKWEYLGITNKYLNSIFKKIDDGKKDENGYREVSQEELTILEKLLTDAAKTLGRTRFFDKDLQEIERQIDNGEIEGLPRQNSDNNIDNGEPQYKERVTHHQNLTRQDLEDIKTGKTDIETIRQKLIDKIKSDLKQYHNYDERFPENKYEVEVVFNGEYYESFVYDKEFVSFKKSDPQKLKFAVEEFEGGNFDVINTIENPVEFLENYRKKTGGKTMFSVLISSYKDGKLSSDKLKEYMYALEKNFEEYEREYRTSNPGNKFDNVYSFCYGIYYDLNSRVNHHIEATEYMQYKYENNLLDKKQVKELQNFVKENYNIELNEYVTARIIEQGSLNYDYGIYEYDFEDIKKCYKNLDKKHVEYYTQFGQGGYTKDDVDRNEIKEMQKLFKDLYNKDLSEDNAAYLIKSKRSEFKKGFNLEKFKQNCLNGQLFENEGVKDFQDYIDKKIIWQRVVENDSLETLEAVAQTIEQEYSRYNFDIHKSKVADLAYQSEKMINKAEKELQVIKNDNKIIIKNKLTRKVRIIDLNQITSKLDDNKRQMLIDAINGFNKISLWEFAVEVTNDIGTSVHDETQALAEYNIENDNININSKIEQKIDSNALLHEMVHAMMATIIDGKNTFNEYLFQEFAATYEEEQTAHREKRLRNGSADGSNYTYCAQNIMEFAAEAGCLWLGGKSNSEFTIATHFPKSYRLFVELIERIRTQKTGRSTNEKV